jgi:hypothetical protein
MDAEGMGPPWAVHFKIRCQRRKYLIKKTAAPPAPHTASRPR